MTTALNVANYVISNYGRKMYLSNLRLNKLLYYIQVSSLRNNNTPLFDDVIEAWQFGPVIPSVYRTYKVYGKGRIEFSSHAPKLTKEEEDLIDRAMAKYGWLYPIDILRFSHRDGGAWKNVYKDGVKNIPITLEDIRNSADFTDEPQGNYTKASKEGAERFKNTLKLLRDA